MCEAVFRQPKIQSVFRQPVSLANECAASRGDTLLMIMYLSSTASHYSCATLPLCSTARAPLPFSHTAPAPHCPCPTLPLPYTAAAPHCPSAPLPLCVSHRTPGFLFFRARFTSLHTHTSLLTFFACFFILFHSCLLCDVSTVV